MSSKRNSQIYVSKFSRSTNEDDLNDHFKEFGRIRDVSLKNGYAFIVKFRKKLNKNYIYQLLIKVSAHLFCYMKKAEFQGISVLFAEKRGH